MEPVGSLPHSQEPATCPYPELFCFYCSTIIHLGSVKYLFTYSGTKKQTEKLGSNRCLRTNENVAYSEEVICTNVKKIKDTGNLKLDENGKVYYQDPTPIGCCGRIE
jgi:hypothetical protein